MKSKNIIMSSATEHLSNFDHKDQETRRRARIFAILALLLLLLLLLYPIFSYTFPLPEKPGILLSFGEPNGGGELTSSLLAVNENTPNESAKSSAPVEEKEEEASKQETTAKSVKTNVEQITDELSVIKTSKSTKKKETQVKTKSNATDLKKVEAEKIAKAEAAQKLKKEAEAKERKAQEAAKTAEFGNFFSGVGKGDQAKKQGDPDGAPDKAKLDGISTGKANIGGGIAERGVLFEPTIDENSQKIGRIVVRVCVNGKGIVTEAKFTQKGSTSTDISLIEVAEKAARQYRFSPSGLEKQCGTISIDFKLK